MKPASIKSTALWLTKSAAFTGTAFALPAGYEATIQFFGTVSSSSGSCVLNLLASNDGTNYFTIGAATLALTSSLNQDAIRVPDGFYSYRFDLASINVVNGTISAYLAKPTWSI